MRFECAWRWLAAALLVAAEAVHGWVPTGGQMSWRVASPSELNRVLLHAANEPPIADNANADAEEEECYDLCDDDHMPVFHHQDDEEPAATMPEIDKETARSRLEMRWGLYQNEEACDLEKDINTCGERCEDCQGYGVVKCRFCGGSTALLIGNHAISCPVCATSQGVETCKSCRGSGYIASWTSAGNSTLI